METKEWYLAHQYTEEEYNNIVAFFEKRKRRKEVRRLFNEICEKHNLKHYEHDRSVHADNIESLNSVMADFKAQGLEPIKIAVTYYGEYDYSAYYNF